MISQTRARCVHDSRAHLEALFVVLDGAVEGGDAHGAVTDGGHVRAADLARRKGGGHSGTREMRRLV
jgi:hypothetical protein